MGPLLKIKEWTLVPAVNLGTLASVSFLEVESILKLGMLVLTIGWTAWQFHRSVSRHRADRKVVPEDCPFVSAPDKCPLIKSVLADLRK